MELNIVDRLLILNLDTLPRVGSIVTMKVKQQLLNDAGFSEEEIKESGLKTSDDGNVSWDKMIIKDINIGDSANNLLINALEKSENLSDMYVPLYDKLKACISDGDKQ